MNSVYP
jgi:hypothetical protein